MLKRPCALGLHERTCKLNPNRKPLENHVSGFIGYNKKHNAPYGTWKCEECNLIFETRNLFYRHKHERFEEYKERDKKKEELLKENSWSLLRIKWKECFARPKEFIEIIRNKLKELTIIN